MDIYIAIIYNHQCKLDVPMDKSFKTEEECKREVIDRFKNAIDILKMDYIIDENKLEVKHGNQIIASAKIYNNLRER